MKCINIVKKCMGIILYKIEKIRLAGYNEFTIENYFRKKGYFIGKNNRIYIRSFGTEPYLIKIGDHCTITTGVVFITHDGGAWVFRREMPELNVFGKIEIKDNCFIGINSIILPNVTIGPNSVVGAGSVVTKDVPPNSVVAGVPAKFICSVEEYKERCLKKWSCLELKGPREEWREQLIYFFWSGEKHN
jgi:acetyltransferase-like isoleucine patch superfamily enzyme